MWLYQDNAFNDWKTNRETAGNETENEKLYIDGQSDYTLTMECNVTSIEANDSTANKSGYGCCLQDLSQNGGGYCMVINSSRDDVDTYYLTQANFETVLTSPYDLSSMEVPTDKYSGITIFYIEDATSKTEKDANRPFKRFYGTKI